MPAISFGVAKGSPSAGRCRKHEKEICIRSYTKDIIAVSEME